MYPRRQNFQKGIMQQSTKNCCPVQQLEKTEGEVTAFPTCEEVTRATGPIRHLFLLLLFGCVRGTGRDVVVKGNVRGL
jgi:hypothetical protein